MYSDPEFYLLYTLWKEMKNILSALSESPATDSVRSKYYKCNFFNPEIPEGF